MLSIEQLKELPMQVTVGQILPLSFFTLIFFIASAYLYLKWVKLKVSVDRYTELEDDLDEAEKELASLRKQVEKHKKNPDGSLEVLNDLMHNKNTILRVTRVDPSSIFLRSPKE